ncbi:MAG TPA: septal ring lytic transglycosylase RlpA family protein [Candidatus Kapabacteria bacterium]|nr:septal ring lytic transglycosylase RlpA family protein [Candidatus Kapabacteria bacterium]
MTRVNNIKRLSKEMVDTSAQIVLEFPRAVITAEEKLRRRVQAFVRVALATSFLWLTAIISLGATVTDAVAKTVGKDKNQKERRIHLRTNRLSDKNAASMKGTASWYGKHFHKRLTASGRPFDKNAMMAAHRSLPFGTIVRVTNTENGKSCLVEITDRGPFVRKRIIDLSEAAAKALDFTDQGTTHVVLEVVSQEYASLVYSVRPFMMISDALRMPGFAAR